MSGIFRKFFALGNQNFLSLQICHSKPNGINPDLQIKKRNLFSLLVGMFVFLFSGITIVSALDLDFQSAGYQVIQWIKDIFGPFFSVLIGTGEIDEYLFARVLLLIIIYTMVLVVLKKTEIFKNNKGATIMIAVAVSILGVRFLATKALITLILLPYGAMAISLSIFIPFLIYFFFIHYSVSTGLGRKLAWILFAAVFFGLWYTRQDTLEGYDTIYMIAIIGFLLVLIFDSKIHEYFGMFEARKERRRVFNEQIAHIDNDIAWAIRSGADTPEARENLKNLRKRRDQLVRERGGLGWSR